MLDNLERLERGAKIGAALFEQLHPGNPAVGMAVRDIRAALGHLPALLRVARAAREYDTALIANTTQKERARLARELRTALAALDKEARREQ